MKDALRKEHMRRKLERYSKFNITGFFKTRKGKHGENWLFFESYLEHDHLIMFEHDPSVKVIESQPLSISYYWKGKKRYFTTDNGITKVDKNGIFNKYIEIKHSSVMKNDDERSRFKKIKNVFQKNGYPFDVLTERDLLPEQHLRNLEKLNKSIGCIDANSPLIDDALTVMPSEIKLGEAIRVLDAMRIDRGVLSYLLYNQHYQFDLNLPMHADIVLKSNIL